MNNQFLKYHELKESLFANTKNPEVEGLGYGTPEKANKTIEIANKLKKTDPGKAMTSVVSMLNRAKYSNGQTEDMRKAIPIFQKWIDSNKVKESSFQNFEEFILEKKWNKEVKSSHLVSIEYDSDTEILEVEFHDGSVYQYKDVPKSVFRDFSLEKNLLQKIGHGVAKSAKKLFGKDVSEGSFGSRFWELIRRGDYSYKKIK